MKRTVLFIAICAALLSGCSTGPGNVPGVVASATPEATQAGLEVLENGGNAMDAAVAVAFSLAVTEPAMTGLGAGIQILVGIPGEKPFMINGTTYSPASTPTTATREDIQFHRRSTVPSFVKTLDFAFKTYGSGPYSWQQAMQPAIRQAKSGFRMGRFRARVYQQYEEKILDSPYGMQHFLVDGKIPEEGEVLVQPVLAKTLQRLARVGADDFYHGEIATTIAQDMKDNGGWISLKDLNDFPTPTVVPALESSYRRYQVFTSTPPCGGWVVLLALNLMEELDGSMDRDQRLMEALALAHAERQAHPIQNMVDYKSEVSERISKEKASGLIRSSAFGPDAEPAAGTGETTHFSVVDKNGMVVAVTTSINAYFGSRAASPGLGFIYNSYMEDFVYNDSAHPFAVGPGKMAYSSMSPTIVRDKNGENVMATGSPGSARIISAVAQTIQYWIDVKKDIVEAVRVPRVHVTGNKAYMEKPDSTLFPWLTAHGLKFAEVDNGLDIDGLNSYFGGVHAVAFENGQWHGVADPRRDGVAASTR